MFILKKKRPNFIKNEIFALFLLDDMGKKALFGLSISDLSSVSSTYNHNLFNIKKK